MNVTLRGDPDIGELVPEGWMVETGENGNGAILEPETGGDVYVEIADGFSDPVVVSARRREDVGPDYLIDLPKNVLPTEVDALEEIIQDKCNIALQERDR